MEDKFEVCGRKSEMTREGRKRGIGCKGEEGRKEGERKKEESDKRRKRRREEEIIGRKRLIGGRNKNNFKNCRRNIRKLRFSYFFFSPSLLSSPFSLLIPPIIAKILPGRKVIWRKEGKGKGRKERRKGEGRVGRRKGIHFSSADKRRKRQPE